MKLQKVLILFLFFPCSLIFGEYFSSEVNLMYFRPESNRLRDLYSDAWLNSQLRFEGHFNNTFLGQALGLVASVSYTQKKGAPTNIPNEGEGIRPVFTIIPTSLGMNLSLDMAKIRPSIGGGLRYYYAKEKTVSAFKTDFDGLGGYFELGVRLNVQEMVYLNFLLDYGIKTFDKKSLAFPADAFDVKVSGLSAGGGIGLSF